MWICDLCVQALHREPTKQSGILDLLELGDGCMADMGFIIEKILADRRVKLIIMPFENDTPGQPARC